MNAYIARTYMLVSHGRCNYPTHRQHAKASVTNDSAGRIEGEVEVCETTNNATHYIDMPHHPVNMYVLTPEVALNCIAPTMMTTPLARNVARFRLRMPGQSFQRRNLVG